MVDSKVNVKEYDWLSLAVWTSTRPSLYYIINHVQITGHAVCNSKYRFPILELECNVEKFNAVYPCPECTKYVNVYPVKRIQLSFNHIAYLDQAQKFVAFPGMIESMDSLRLAEQIIYYFQKEPEKTKLPLKNLGRWDKLQMLGFAYASIYAIFMGNLTIYHWNYDAIDFKRLANIDEAEYEEYDLILRVRNTFGSLHFVSCGSRGVEPFPFSQFISVFEWQVWLCILISVVLLSIAMLKLCKTVKSIVLMTGPLSIFKILVEQGDPFPANFDKSRQSRYLMSGILLAGLVISNAFKSENVYKIVLPRSHVPYHNIDELIEDNVTLFTRIQRFSYAPSRTCGPWRAGTTDISKYQIDVCKNTLRVLGSAEFVEPFELIPDSDKTRKYSRIHPKAIGALQEPVDYLEDLVKVGFIDSGTTDNILEQGTALMELFTKKQEDLIKNDLTKCS